MNKKSITIIISLLAVISMVPLSAAFTPHSGDTFSYYEVTDLGSGTGDYAGYTEHTTYSGTEAVTGISSDGTVSAHYSYSYSWRNSSGSTETGNPSGDFTFSSKNFLYINGTDDQTGYVNPTVWFAMDNSIPVGGTFTLLDTQMTVISRNYSYYLSSQNKYVSTIFAQGSSSYQRNDIYGQFNAAYTWNVYFDFSTGYIVGYTYEEYDTSPSAGFKYTENLYVTSTSYPLTTVAAGPTPVPTITYITPRPSTITQFLPGFILLPAFAFILLIVIVVVLYVVSKGSKKPLPRHPYQQPYQQPPPPPGPPPENIDLTPKQPPVQQIVIREVVKVKCRYCGALIDSTAQTCPLCGAPRT